MADNINREVKNLGESMVDFNRQIEHENGLMNCYCYSQYKTLGLEVASLKLQAPNSSQEIYPCRDWLLRYRSGRFSVYNLAIFMVLLNYVVRGVACCGLRSVAVG